MPSLAALGDPWSQSERQMKSVRIRQLGICLRIRQLKLLLRRHIRVPPGKRFILQSFPDTANTRR